MFSRNSMGRISDAAIGFLILAYVAFAKHSELRFRARAVRVHAAVVKVFRHRHATAVFVSYQWQGVQRWAEYAALPLASVAPGDAVTILVDPREPDSVVPEDAHNAPGLGVGSGNCSPVDTSVIAWWEWLYVLAGLALLIRALV